MAEITTDDALLHVEVDGEGEPVTLFAHGITNSCRELALLTPMVPGSKVRFCFRGHGHSSSPEPGRYRFADFARDVEAVADAHGATAAVGTSLGAGAICNLLARRPDRFDRLIFLLPAGLDRPFRYRERFLRTADLLETLPKEEAIRALLADPERRSAYERAPWLRGFDAALWADLNAEGVPRAIREVLDDVPLTDRDALRGVTAPALVIGREGDRAHPASVARELAELLPDAELILFTDEGEMFREVPATVQRTAAFLAS